MLEKPSKSDSNTTIELHNQTPTYGGWMLGILGFVVLVALGWSLFYDDNPDVIVIDDSPNVVVDDEVLITTTSDLVASAHTAASFYANPTNNYVIENEAAVVTSVISDRLFTIAAQAGSPELYAYLDDSLDQGSAEGIIEVNVGDTVVIDGLITTGYENRAFTIEESSSLIGVEVLVLVNDIKFAD